MNVAACRWLVSIAGLSMLSSIGCGGPDPAIAAREASNLKPLAVLYMQFAGQHRGQGPRNEAEFKTWIKALPPSQLASFDVKDVESMFISSRDTKPYIVKYGTASGVPGAGGMTVIAYEQQGVEGKRYIAGSLGQIEEVDETKFRSLVPDAK
jgi:hypothetical protein